MARTETINDTAIPSISIKNSYKEKFKPNFTSFRKLAPNITGIAKKNVNSVATIRDKPIQIPPNIVAPDREVPGKTAAIS